MKKILIWSAIISCVIIIAFTILGLVNNAKKDEDIKDSPGVEQPEEVALDPGLYDIETDEMIYTFDELLTEGYFSFQAYGSKLIATDKAAELPNGHLVIAEDKGYLTTGSLSNYPGLVEITLSSSINEICFTECINLEKINYAKGCVISSIGYRCFENCNKLDWKNYKIPATVTGIGQWAFQKIKNLSSLTIPANVTKIGMDAFGQTDIETIIFESVGSLPIATGVSSTNYIFSSTVNIKNIYIADSVTTITDYYFNNIPEGLTIYCGAEEKPEGYSEYWNYNTSEQSYEVKYGYTYDEFLAEVNA